MLAWHRRKGVELYDTLPPTKPWHPPSVNERSDLSTETVLTPVQNRSDPLEKGCRKRRLNIGIPSQET